MGEWAPLFDSHPKKPSAEAASVGGLFHTRRSFGGSICFVDNDNGSIACVSSNSNWSVSLNLGSDPLGIEWNSSQLLAPRYRPVSGLSARVYSPHWPDLGEFQERYAGSLIDDREDSASGPWESDMSSRRSSGYPFVDEKALRRAILAKIGYELRALNEVTAELPRDLPRQLRALVMQIENGQHSDDE
jgi:hypothetical protein